MNSRIKDAGMGSISRFTAIAAGFMLSLASVAQAQDRPNVILMLADNLGYGDVGAYGAGEIRGMPTPNLDRLASEGMRFTQFLVEPGCTPSRAGLMTGRYSIRSGLSKIILRGTTNTLKAEEVTLAEVFKTRGYRTAYMGKWHLGSDVESQPQNQGFDEWRLASSGRLRRHSMAKAWRVQRHQKSGKH